jgi:hypothetical protein
MDAPPAPGEAIYRAPMRARDRDVPGADYGLEHGVVAIGDDRGEKAERMRRRFAELPDGTLVWTRDSGGGYHLGRIAGPLHHDAAAARAVGLGHVRPTAWLPAPLGEGDVPAAVVETFARGGRNLQRIHGAEAERRTAALWAAAGAARSGPPRASRRR